MDTLDNHSKIFYHINTKPIHLIDLVSIHKQKTWEKHKLATKFLHNEPPFIHKVEAITVNVFQRKSNDKNLKAINHFKLWSKLQILWKFVNKCNQCGHNCSNEINCGCGKQFKVINTNNQINKLQLKTE